MRRLWGSLALVQLALQATVLAAPARPIRFDQLSMEQGLSQATVMQVLQDHAGYIWLATEDGLNRYDGVSFKVYSHDPSDPASLPSSFVWTLAEDGSGNLWVATTSGLAMWERASDRISRHPALAGSYLRALHFAAEQNALFIGTRDSGLVKLDLSNGATTRFVHDPADPSSLADNRIYTLYGDSRGRLWVGTDGGLAMLDAEGKGFVRYLAGPKGLSDAGVRAIAEDPSGGLWVGTLEGGLNLLDPESGACERFRSDVDRPNSLAHDQVRALLVDSERRLWVGTIQGLDLFDREGRTFTHYRHDPRNPRSLGNDHILALTQDRGGILWVGTRLGGAHKWNPRSWQLGHVVPDPTSPTGLGSGNVTAFSEDHLGRLWVGTFDAGLYAMERTSEKMTPFRHDPKDPRTIASDKVMSLLHDRKGELWIGTFNAGLDRLDPATGLVRHYRNAPRRPDSLSADGVTSILEDRGRLWLGTYGGGLERFDPDAERFTHFRNDPKDLNSLSGDRVSTLALAPSGSLWVGTMEKGLNLLDPVSGRFRRYGHRPGDPGSLPSDSILALFVEPAGGLWVAAQGGLSYLAPEAESFRTYTTKDGLPSDVVYGIRGDRQGRLWLSTSKGIACFDPRSGAFNRFGVSDGVQAADFNFGACYQSPSGEVFFGGINGFNAFVPERVQRGTQAPPVVLTAVTVGRQPVAGPADQTRRIALDYRDHVLGFDFAALDFGAPERNQFSCKLDGFDPDWVPLGGRQSVTYTNLRPGRYLFRLRAANSDGVWSPEGLSVDVDVAAAPWRTPWAYAVYAALLAAGVFAMVRVQRRKLEREADYARALERRVEERTQELSARQVELERANHELAQASITDALTGLANRRFLVEYLEREVPLLHRRYRRLEQGTLDADSIDMAFVMVDLDHFKEVNDSAGHAAGDALLKQIKELLTSVSRSSDIIVRWGGDEFLVVARDQTGDGLIEFAERIRTTIAQHVFELGEGRVVRTTCSIGFARYPFIRQRIDALTWEQVISVADRALYLAKASGRDTWVGFHPGVGPLPSEGLFGMICHQTQKLVHEGGLRVSSSLTGIRKLVWDADEGRAPAAGGETGGAEVIPMRPKPRGPGPGKP